MSFTSKVDSGRYFAPWKFNHYNVTPIIPAIRNDGKPHPISMGVPLLNANTNRTIQSGGNTFLKMLGLGSRKPKRGKITAGCIGKKRKMKGGCGGCPLNKRKRGGTIGFTPTDLQVGDIYTGSYDGRARIIRPGQPITKDHQPARLNIILDNNNKIVNVRRG